jgi:hypothetical protein
VASLPPSAVALWICGFVVYGALVFSLLKFLVAISSHVSLPSEFLHTWAYGISPCHKGKNRDEKKPVSEIAGTLCLNSWWQNAVLTFLVLQNFLPGGNHFFASAAAIPPAPQGYKARRKQIDSVIPTLIHGCSFEVLCTTFVLISRHEIAPFTHLSSDCFACSEKNLCLTASFPPPQGHKPRPKEADAYFMTSPGSGSNHATATAQTASPAAHSQQQQVLVRSSSSQQQPATTSQRCCHSTKHQEAPPQAGSTGSAGVPVPSSQ